MSIRPRLSTLMADQSTVRGPYTDDMKLAEDLYLDTLDMVDLSLRCEDEFHIVLSEEDITLFEEMTFGGLARLIDKRRRVVA